MFLQGFFLNKITSMPLNSSYTSHLLEAGLDEVGRGCLAGPVVAAFVILPKDYFHPYLNDSKKISRNKREQLREEIYKEAIDYAVGEATNQEIDKINILNATFLAMHRALDQAKTTPELLLIDGNRFKAYKELRHHCIVGGDGLYYSIAAASILAKTHRDDLMDKLSLIYPNYGWDTNAAYGTLKHRKAIENDGITPYHRISFALTKKQLDLF